MKSKTALTIVTIPVLSTLIYLISATVLSNDVRYRNVYINYDKLKTLLSSKNLNTLYLQNKYVKTGFTTRYDYVTLTAFAYDINGNVINTVGLISDEDKGEFFPKTKTFANYIASKPQIDSLLKFTVVTSFKLAAIVYADPTYNYYNISLFPTPTGATAARAFLNLNPCPPAQAYKPTDN